MHDAPLNWEQVREHLTDKIGKYGVVDEDAVNLCIRATRMYMENPIGNIEHIVGTEEQLAVAWDEKSKSFVETDWDAPNCYGRGKIDILQINGDVATIIDHKTQLNIETADTFQMGFYAWLVTKYYPFLKEVNTILHFCHPDLNRYSLPYTWSRAEIDDIEEQIRIRVDGIEKLQDFYEAAGHHCTFCPIKLECGLLNELHKIKTKFGSVKAGPMIDAQSAHRAAEVLIPAEHSQKVIKSNLNAFTKEFGSIIINGMEYGHFPSESWTVQPGKEQELFDLLKECGVDPFQVFTCDSRALKGCWRGFKKPLIDRIKEKLYLRTKTSFRSRKVPK